MKPAKRLGRAQGTGKLVLGGIDSSLYTGTLAYTPVTDESYYCVTMTAPAGPA